MSKFLHPTVEVKDYAGRKKLLSFIKRSDDGLLVLTAVLGCDATPVWISTAALAPLVREGKVLQA